MTKLESLVARVSQLPQRRQEEIVDALAELVELAAPSADAPDWHLEVLQRRLDAPEDLASDAEVEAFFARSGV